MTQMKTKKIFHILLLAAILCGTACDDKLDIVPLGETTLDTVDDLETLLNQVPQLYMEDNEFEILCNNMYCKWEGLPEYLSNPNSIIYALVTYDETVDRANLVTSSSMYENLYQSINYMNVVISKAPDAEGDDAKRRQIIAEAHVLRAWYHFLLVNMYAKQYDESTAGQLGGIPYVDNTDVSEQKTKRTVAEVYECILADCSEEVLADLVQSHVDDPCRFGLDFGYGVRAKVLFQMKRYDEALQYATRALQVNNTIEDRSTVMTTSTWTLNETAQNNYYIIWSDNSNLGDFYGITVTPEVAALISPDDYVNKYYYVSGTPAWQTPYPTLPDGCLQCQVSDIKYNLFGIRSETMYYLAAECQIRIGNIAAGLQQVDRVQEQRIENDQARTPQASTLTEREAMKLLQDAKRVEFLGCFDNFCDRKRWNSEADYAETIVRDLGPDYGGTYSLRPDSPLWVWPFPQNAVLHNSSLTQNY
mgnify:CR=1 FL=1